MAKNRSCQDRFIGDPQALSAPEGWAARKLWSRRDVVRSPFSDDTPHMATTPMPSAWASELPDLIGEQFPHSRPETRQALARAASIRTFRAGHAIVQQGDDSSLALVLDGHVAVRRTTVEGRQLIMEIVTRGGLASVLPLATRPAGADAVALTPGTAAVWHGVEVRSLATIDPGLAVDILERVLVAFERAVERIDGLVYQSALRRVARVLDDHADLFFAERPVLSRADLPAMIGTSREMTGRVLRLLERRRVVSRVGRHRLRLLDAAGLAAAAESGLDEPMGARGTRSLSVVSPRHDAVRVVRRDLGARAGRANAGLRDPKARTSAGWSMASVATGRRG
jgi:CRP-like cAMP-binding protein